MHTLTFFALLFGMVLGSTFAMAAENYSTWTYSSDITLNTSPTGADVSAGVTGFPVLIRLSSNNFIFSEARGLGQDIRFAKPDSTPLNYQIERWDSANAVADVWVKTDVAGNQAGQILRMYWGNATVSDSSDGGATFNQDYAQVWHLGDSGTSARLNSVTGGLSAGPVNYDGDESIEGIIGRADNLDGGGSGDYLDIGDGYSEFSGGFTYSVWLYPTAVKLWNHILDLGNGQGLDNILINRVNTITDMQFTNINGTASTLLATNVWALNQWQYFTVTVSGSSAKIYKNGTVVASSTLTNTISSINRTENFLGRSNWAVDEYYQGRMDEPEFSKVARSDAWVKLAYQNQKPNQSLVTLKLPNRCQVAFNAPADTTANEGETVALKATVNCASSIAWSVVSGPAPKILDPEVKVFSVILPRVAKDTILVYRFTATFTDSTQHKDIRVTIKENIPDPIFTFPTDLTWNGKDTLAFRPTVTNLAAIKASKDSILHWVWTLSGPEADTTWLADGLRLNKGFEGNLQIGLCLDNGGTPTCDKATLTISASTSTFQAPFLNPNSNRVMGRDALGRLPAVIPNSAPRDLPLLFLP